jgi:predicted RNase H-like HicB family nuclease
MNIEEDPESAHFNPLKADDEVLDHSFNFPEVENVSLFLEKDVSDEGIYVSASDFANVVQLKEDYDHAREQIEEMQAHIKEIRLLSENQQRDLETKLSASREETREAYEKRLVLNNELIRERDAHSGLKAHLSAKLSGTSCLRRI